MALSEEVELVVKVALTYSDSSYSIFVFRRSFLEFVCDRMKALAVRMAVEAVSRPALEEYQSW